MEPDSESDFHDTYRKLWRVRKDFLKEYLRSLDPSLAGLTSEKLSRCETSSDGTIRSLFFLATHTMPETPWPEFCHRKQTFRNTFVAVYAARGQRLKNLVPVEKGDKISADWQSSGVFVFGPADSTKKTTAAHISRKMNQLTKEDELDGEKSWEVIDNWCELKAQLRVGKAMAKILDLFPEDFREETLKRWSNNKDYIQQYANEETRRPMPRATPRARCRAPLRHPMSLRPRRHSRKAQRGPAHREEAEGRRA